MQFALKTVIALKFEETLRRTSTDALEFFTNDSDSVLWETDSTQDVIQTGHKETSISKTLCLMGRCVWTHHLVEGFEHHGVRCPKRVRVLNVVPYAIR